MSRPDPDATQACRSGWQRLLSRLPPLLGLILLAAAVFAVQREFRHLSLSQIRDSMWAIPDQRLLASAGFTLLSYFILSFYDRLATIHVGQRLSFGRTAFAAFCSYVLSHNLGFAAISGAAVRFRLYGNWGLKPLDITRIIAFCSVTYVLGACALIGAVLLLEPGALSTLSAHVPRWLFALVGIAACAVVVAYIGFAARLPMVRVWRWSIPLPGVKMALGQVVVAALEVAATAAIAYALLPPDIGLSYPAFLAIYIAAYSAGLLSSVPGGLGVFDGAMILGLSPFLPSAEALVVILVFRLFYYIVPLFIAGLLFASHEVFLRGDILLARRQGVLLPSQLRPSTVIRESEADFAVTVAVGAVILCGAMLLALGLVQPDTPDLAFALPPPGTLFGPLIGMQGGFALVVQAAGDYIPSLIGAALIGLAIGLSQRVTLAWGATLVLLCVATVLTALRGSSLAVPGVLVLSALVIAPFRSSYYRRARLLSEPLSPTTVVPLLLLLACLVTLGQLEPDVHGLMENSLPEVMLGAGMSGRTRLSVGLAVLVALVALGRLILPGRIEALPWSADAQARYLVAMPEGEAMPRLRGEPDGLLAGETGRAMIPFRRQGRILVGLGDPAGPASDQISTIWRLRDLAVQEGREPVFWRVGPMLLDVYADLGLEAWPLDEAEPRFLCCPAERGQTLLALFREGGR